MYVVLLWLKKNIDFGLKCENRVYLEMSLIRIFKKVCYSKTLRWIALCIDANYFRTKCARSWVVSQIFAAHMTHCIVFIDHSKSVSLMEISGTKLDILLANQLYVNTQHHNDYVISYCFGRYNSVFGWRVRCSPGVDYCG